MTEDLHDRDRGQAFRRWFWGAMLLGTVVWYAVFRVAAPLRYEPLTGGFHGNDFKHIYLGAWMLPRGLDPYDAAALRRTASLRGFATVNPYVYLPFTGLVLSPLAALDPPDALRVWFATNHVLLFGALALMFWSLRIAPSVRNFAVVVGLAAVCWPLHRTLTAGQLNCALLFLYALVFSLERRRLWLLAGGVAAFAFLFKLAPGILLPYFLWRWIRERGLRYTELAEKRKAERRARKADAQKPESKNAAGGKAASRPNLVGVGHGPLRAAVSMCVVAGLLLAGSVWWVGAERHLAFRPLLAQMGYGKSTWAESGARFYRAPENQSLNSLFHHLFSPEPGVRAWADLGPKGADALTRLAFLLCVSLALGRTWPWRWRKGRLAGRPVDGSALYGIFILLGLLAPSIYWDHYAVIALWPLVACHARLPDRARGSAFLLFLCLAMPLGSFLEHPPWWTGFWLAVALGAAVWLVSRGGRGSWRAIAWGLAGALLLARFPHGLEAFRQGIGLLAMSPGLWGTLILFGLCLSTSSEEKPSGAAVGEPGD